MQSQNDRIEELQTKENALNSKQKELENSVKKDAAKIAEHQTLNQKLTEEQSQLKKKIDDQILALENATKQKAEYEK